MAQETKNEETCKMKSKGHGHYHCETCGIMGKKHDVMRECPLEEYDSYAILDMIMGGGD